MPAATTFLSKKYLLSHRLPVYTGTDPVLKTFRNSWLPTALKDPATFHQFLANVSLNLYQIQGRARSRTVSGEHHAIALRTVNNALSDPTRNTADAIVASIVTFVCYCVSGELKFRHRLAPIEGELTINVACRYVEKTSPDSPFT